MRTVCQEKLHILFLSYIYGLFTFTMVGYRKVLVRDREAGLAKSHMGQESNSGRRESTSTLCQCTYHRLLAPTNFTTSNFTNILKRFL